MSRDHIPGFPNKMPKVDWLQDLPMFRNVECNDVALHLVKFHIHVHKLNINFPEDCLMKMFMATLEDEARYWYESFSPACIYCLNDFHTISFERYKETCPSLILVQNCCEHVNSFIEDLENFYGDNELMDREIMEALYESSFQQNTKILEDSYQDQQVEDCHMVENHGRQSVISDLIEIKDDMQEMMFQSQIAIELSQI